jgi:hypothetical protein
LQFVVRGPGEETRPSVALSGDVALVVWEDSRLGNRDLALRHSPDGGVTWGLATRLVSSPSDESLPTCDVSTGLASCSWIDSRTGELSPHARESLDAGQSWQPRFVLD